MAAVYDNFPEGQGDSVAVGEGASTDVIPRVWAERILGELRASHRAIWVRLLGNASAPRG